MNNLNINRIPYNFLQYASIDCSTALNVLALYISPGKNHISRPPEGILDTTHKRKYVRWSRWSALRNYVLS